MPPLLHRQAEAGRQRRPHREVRAPLRPAQGLTTIEPERRGALLDAKLGALIRDALGVTGGAPLAFPGGAARRDGHRAWLLVDGDADRALGPALAWARKHGIEELHLLADAGVGALARRAAAFRRPPTVWWVQGRDLHPTEPEPLPPPAPVPGAEQLTPLLRGVGLDVVVEDGFVAGELRGLEVARIVPGEDGPRLEVGVGQADRELTQMLHGALAPTDSLERVIAIVGEQRRPGAPPHPLNRLVPERWLRWWLARNPQVVGLDALDASTAPVRRGGLKERHLAAAAARRGDEQVVVVCSVGIDLDLVPAATDARAAIAPGAPLLVVVPARDDLPVTRALAAELREPAEVVTVPDTWRDADLVA